MIERGPSRFPWIDLWILPTVLLIALAVLRLDKAEPEIARQDHALEEWRQVFTECQKRAKQSVENPQRQRRESDREWQQRVTLRGEYLNLAEHLEAAVPGLQTALEQAESHKAVAENRQRVQELKTWIAREQERVSIERLESDSKELKARLERAQLSATNSPRPVIEDLGSLISAIDRNYQQYLSDYKTITDNQGKPLVGGLVAARTASGRQAVGRLGEIAQHARQDVQTLDVALESEPRSEATEQSSRQQEMLQAFMEASSPAEFVRRIGPEVGNSAEHSQRGTSSIIRQVRYGLMGTLVALGAFLIVDVYRRVIVSPLRLKLVQSEGLIEHQKKLAHFEELAAGLAHEIRNPLTAISARLYTIQRKLREDTAEYKDTVVIGSEIERANQILKEFIQLTRPAPPKLELITAGLLLDDVTHLMAPQLERRAVRLEVRLPTRTQFYGDQQQLKQVLVNLIQNAAESMDKGGEVILRAREDRVAFKGALTRAAIIEVEDNGPGIRPEVQDRLFEPFFSTKKEGTGLGLPISARIIDRHGGRLDFETQPQRGTIFRIVLPSYEEQ